MNWIFTSILMMISSIVYYLIIRFAQKKSIPNKAYMVANFSIPAVFFFIMAHSQSLSILIPLRFIVIILLQSFVLSYLGSIVSYKAIQQSPNAGYSLVIQKSYAVYTSVAAIFLFQSNLTPVKFLAILAVLFSSAILSISRQKKSTGSGINWVFLSFVAFFCYGSSALVSKYLYIQGIPSFVLLFWIMTFVTCFSLYDLYTNRTKVTFGPHKVQNMLILFFIGFSVTFFYYFKQVSEVTAPNIGYVGAMNTASNGIYTLLVAYVFKEHLSVKKFGAVLGVIIGILFIIL